MNDNRTLIEKHLKNLRGGRIPSLHAAMCVESIRAKLKENNLAPEDIGSKQKELDEYYEDSYEMFAEEYLKQIRKGSRVTMSDVRRFYWCVGQARLTIEDFGTTSEELSSLVTVWE